MKSKTYYFINRIILIVAFLLLCHNIYNVLKNISHEHGTVPWFITAVLLTAAVYVIKAVRLYLILLKRRIAVCKYLKLFIKTTLVTLVLPLKTGELFKVYCYGTEMHTMKRAFLCVLVERYFDAIPLAVLLVSFTIYDQADIFLIVILLIFFLLAITCCYLIFPSVFYYINRFCIVNINSEKGILLLDILKKYSSGIRA